MTTHLMAAVVLVTAVVATVRKGDDPADLLAVVANVLNLLALLSRQR